MREPGRNWPCFDGARATAKAMSRGVTPGEVNSGVPRGGAPDATARPPPPRRSAGEARAVRDDPPARRATLVEEVAERGPGRGDASGDRPPRLEALEPGVPLGGQDRRRPVAGPRAAGVPDECPDRSAVGRRRHRI